MTSGIYQIGINNRPYIGSSKNIEKRFLEHFSALRKNKHYNPKFQRTFNKYQECSLKILEEVEDDLLEIEQKYLDNIEDWSIVLNICKTAGSGPLTATDFILYSPEGIEYQGSNVHAFARQHNLLESSLGRVVCGLARSYKGWTNDRRISEFFQKYGVCPVSFEEPRYLKDPEENIHEVWNVRSFCRHHNLSQGNINEMFLGNRKSHKGWKVYQV